jgi:hypothetical protein
VVEWEGIYNYIIILILVVTAISAVYIFAIKPATDKTLVQKNFEENRNVFLSRYCSNLGYTSFKIEDIGNYNGYCFTESSPMVRVISYFHYSYDVKDGSYTFYIIQERK